MGEAALNRPQPASFKHQEGHKVGRLWLDEGLPRADGQSLNHLQVGHQKGSWLMALQPMQKINGGLHQSTE